MQVVAFYIVVVVAILVWSFLPIIAGVMLFAGMVLGAAFLLPEKMADDKRLMLAFFVVLIVLFCIGLLSDHLGLVNGE